MSRLDNILTWDIDGHKEPVIFKPELKKAIKKVYLEIIDEAEKEWGSPKYTRLREKVEQL